MDIRRKRNEDILEKLTSGNRIRDDFDKTKYDYMYNKETPESIILDSIHTMRVQSNNKLLHPENNAVATLYLCALQSAFLHNDTTSSLYTIFKNAEELIPAILKVDQSDEKVKLTVDVMTEDNFKYYSIPKSSAHLLNSDMCYGYISFYKDFIPYTHISNMSKWDLGFLKKVKIVPFSKIESNIYNSRKKNNNVSVLFKQWEKKVDDEKYVSNLKPEFDKTAKIFAERTKMLSSEKYVKRANKYPFNRFDMVYHQLMSKRQSPALKEAAIDLEIANHGYEKSLPEITDIEYMFLQVALFWDNSITRTKSTTGKKIIEIGKALNELETPEERKLFYQFLGKMILEYDNKKPLLQNFLSAAKEHDKDIPFEMTFSLYGEKQVMHNSMNPLYRQTLKSNFAKDIEIWYDGHIN